MGVTEVGKANTGLKTCAETFATNTVIELFGRPHVDVFFQNRLNPSKIDRYIKLIPATDNFV